VKKTKQFGLAGRPWSKVVMSQGRVVEIKKKNKHALHREKPLSDRRAACPRAPGGSTSRPEKNRKEKKISQ